jgi:hypothetical protein
MVNSAISVTDNGCGMSSVEFKQFLRPNFSFKDGKNSRGCKGVGTTYLAYGFNHLEIATKQYDGQAESGRILNGRIWVEDKTESQIRPKVENCLPTHAPFDENKSGTSVVVKLIGGNIRPKNLSWLGADNADQWLAILQANTPIGGIYLCGKTSPNIDIELEVISPSGIATTQRLESPRYLYPHEVVKNTADLGEFLKEQAKKVKQNKDVTQIPSKYQNLNGIWMQWTGDQILDKTDNSISSRLDVK